MKNVPEASIHRVFIGVPVVINSDFRSKVHALKNDLNMNRISWVREELMHITVRFLGNITSKQLRLLKQGFAQFEYSEPITIKIKGIGLFGMKRSPKVIYAKVENVAPWILLNKRVNNMLKAVGFCDEPKDYKPHLTLGRIRKVNDFEIINKATEYHVELEQNDLKLCLYESKMSPSGPIYTIIDSVPLTNF